MVAVAANIQTFFDIRAAVYDKALERQCWARQFHDRTIGPFACVDVAFSNQIGELDFPPSIPTADPPISDDVNFGPEGSGAKASR